MGIMHGESKPLFWVGASREDVCAFPELVRRGIGHQLWRVQAGLAPDDFRPMPSVGAGVQEIRIHAATEHRVIYVAKSVEAVYVLHTFEKRTRKTSPQDIRVARRRPAQVVRWRQAGSGSHRRA